MQTFEIDTRMSERSLSEEFEETMYKTINALREKSIDEQLIKSFYLQQCRIIDHFL
jgi:hypothetical protein